MKMEQTECFETSAYKIQRPGNYPEEVYNKYVLRLTQLYAYVIIILLLATSFGLKSPSPNQYLQKIYVNIGLMAF